MRKNTNYLSKRHIVTFFFLICDFDYEKGRPKPSKIPLEPHQVTGEPSWVKSIEFEQK